MAGLNPIASSGGIDASIPLQAGAGQQQQQMNPLQMMQGVQAVKAVQLDMALKQQQAIRQSIGGLLSDPDAGVNDMGPKIREAMANGVQAGIYPLAQATQEIQNIPSDPKQQKTWLMNHAYSAMNGEAQIQAQMPQQTIVNNGGGNTLLNTNRMTGAVTQPQGITGVANTLSPGELATPMEVQDQNTGEVRQVTKQQWLQDGGRTLKQIGPADKLAIEASGTQLANDQADAAGYAGRIYAMNGALTGLQGATTGKGSETLNYIKSVLNTYHVPVPGGVDSVTNLDEANKWLSQIITQRANSAGANTNEKLATVISGNANTNISNLAAQDMVRAGIGLEQMKQAQLQAFQKSGLPRADYQQFAQNFNNRVNPAVFVWDNMSDAAKHKYWDSLSASQQRAFYAQHSDAVNNGWVATQAQSSQAPAANKGAPVTSAPSNAPFSPALGGQ